MNRTTHSTAKQNLFGAGKHGYTDGAPGLEAPTVLNSAAMNPIQEEIANTIELNGLTLDQGDRRQLFKAIRRSTSQRIERSAVSDLRLWAPLTGSVTDMCGSFGAAGVLRSVCVVGSSGHISTAAPNAALTQRTAGSGYTGTFRGCCSMGDLLFACGSSGQIQRALDASLTWNSVVAAGGGQDLRAIASDNGNTVLAMGLGTPAHVSTDGSGSSWSSYSQPATNIAALTYARPLDEFGIPIGTALWVAVTPAGVVFTSTTGLSGSWTQRFTAAGTSPGLGGFQKISYSPESGFVFDILHGSGPDRSIAYSTDGITWSQSAVYSSHPAVSTATVGHFKVGYTTARLVNFSAANRSDLHILSSPAAPAAPIISAPDVLRDNYAVLAKTIGGRVYVAAIDASLANNLFYSSIVA